MVSVALLDRSPFLAGLVLAMATAGAAAQDPVPQHLFSFRSDAPADRQGTSVAGAGDVDADGFDDLLIGAPNRTAGGPGSGRAVVFSGRDGSRLWTLDGDSAGDRLGFAVTGAGDVDGDGRADLLIGSPGGTPPEGSVTLVSGRTGLVLRTWAGAQPGDRFGQALAGGGDVDGDGTPDLIVGAPLQDAGGTNSGRATVLCGRTGGVLHTVDGAPWDQLGFSVALLSDLDGDGCAEWVAGAPFSDTAAFNGGRALVLSGAGGHVLFAVDGPGIGDQLGARVAGAGDVDADGLEDLVVGIPGSDLGGLDSGAARVASGAGGALLLELAGTGAGEYLQAVAAAGDVDGDGHADLALGAASAGVSGAGRVRIVSGRDGSLLADFPGQASNDWFGAALAAAGDVDGDGRDDLAVGAPGHDDDPTKLGTVTVLSGRARSLVSDTHALSLSAGGTQRLFLRAPARYARNTYHLLGSRSGMTPPAPFGRVKLPLAPEPGYFLFTLTQPNTGPLSGSRGALGPRAEAVATVSLAAGSRPSLAGSVVHHAFLVFGPAGRPLFASEAVSLLLVP